MDEIVRLRIERDMYLKALRWYAHPEQWEVLRDGRGRETLVWRWGDDGGDVARHAIQMAAKLIAPARNTDDQGAVGLASEGAVIVGDAAPLGCDGGDFA